MRLHLLRHAIAVPRGDPAVDSDAERPLTQDGRVQARQVARGIRALGIELDLITTSPFTRARETADLVAEVIGFRGEQRELGQLMPEAQPEDTRDAFEELQLADDVLLVGHKPHLPRFAAHLLTGTHDGVALRLGKADLCTIDVAIGTPEAHGQLQRLLAARELRAFGRA